MVRPKLTLYLDVVSPFAYIAFHYITNSPAFKAVDVTYVPIFLGGVMKACGNTPPLHVKNKDVFIERDRLRWAAYANAPMIEKMPPGFPINTLAPMRALTALSLSHPHLLVKAFTALYAALWSECLPIAETEMYTATLTSAVGKEITGQIVAAAGTKEVKDRLAANTTRAVDEGAFGLPWFVATDAQGRTEGFFGFDHLGCVMDHLGLEREGRLKALL